MRVPAHQTSSACLASGSRKATETPFSYAEDEGRDGRSRRECQHPWTVRLFGVMANSPVSKDFCYCADGIGRAAGRRSPSVNAQERRNPYTRCAPRIDRIVFFMQVSSR